MHKGKFLTSSPLFRQAAPKFVLMWNCPIKNFFHSIWLKWTIWFHSDRIQRVFTTYATNFQVFFFVQGYQKVCFKKYFKNIHVVQKMHLFHNARFWNLVMSKLSFFIKLKSYPSFIFKSCCHILFSHWFSSLQYIFKELTLVDLIKSTTEVFWSLGKYKNIIVILAFAT